MGLDGQPADDPSIVGWRAIFLFFCDVPYFAEYNLDASS